MGSKSWAKSGNTPDWVDVMAAIRAIDGLHLGVTMVTILPVGTGSSGGMRVAISTSWESAPGTVEMPCVLSERVCEDFRNDALPAFILGGIYSQDFAIGEAYQQRSFEAVKPPPAK